MTNKRLVNEQLLKFSLIFLILSALIGVGSRTYADTDLWGHLRFGLDMIDAGKIIDADQYSYLSQGQPWINHELLSSQGLSHKLNPLKRASILFIPAQFALDLIQRGIVLFSHPFFKVIQHGVNISNPVYIKR